MSSPMRFLSSGASPFNQSRTGSPPAPVRKRRRLLLPKHSPLDPFKGRFVAALCHHERVALAGGGQRRVALALGAMRRASDLDRRTVRRQSSEGRVREAPVRGAANSCRVKAGWWGSPPSYRRSTSPRLSSTAPGIRCFRSTIGEALAQEIPDPRLRRLDGAGPGIDPGDRDTSPPPSSNTAAADPTGSS